MSGRRRDDANAIPLPWLMLAAEDGEEEAREFFNPRTGKVLTVALPETIGNLKRCMSSIGWVVTTDVEGVMELFHPLSRNQIELPQFNTYEFWANEHWPDPAYLIHKAVLSANPSLTKDYAIMVIAGENYCLAFWKPGLSAWTGVEGGRAAFYDVIYFRGQFLAIKWDGDIISYGIGESDQTTRKIVGKFDPGLPESRDYLVECSGEFLVVSRHFMDQEVDDRYWTEHFRVFRSDGDFTTWKEIHDLGGHSIFVGHNSSFSLPAAAEAGMKPDCIYFTDDIGDARPDAGKDMGIYSLKEQKMEPHYRGSKFLSTHCPPLWVTPSFSERHELP